MQMQTQEILSWFGPSSPHATRLKFFLSLILYTQNQHLVHHLANSLCQMYTTLLTTKKTTTPCTTSRQPEDALIQSFSLSDYNQSYKP